MLHQTLVKWVFVETHLQHQTTLVVMDNSSRICNNCRERSVVFDSASSTYVCSSCGIENESDFFRSHLDGSFNAPQGTFVRIGASQFNNYRDKKRYDARNHIDDVASSLGLSSQRSAEIQHMIQQITDDEFGAGHWFSILIAACAHVVMRQNRLPLSISEIATVTGSDVHEIGRMVVRVTDFLELKLPEFNVFAAFERAIKSCHCFSTIPSDKSDQMLNQGRFLLQCCVKWFLTTGRQPTPIIAAVSALVAEVNGVDVRIEVIAKDMHAGINTSKLRYKELKETLIKVAQALPWGKDVTEKNLVKNAPLILRYMVMKSKQDSKSSGESIGFDLREMVSECMQKEVEYTTDGYLVQNDSQYFSVEDRDGMSRCHDLESRKLSENCLSKSYGEHRIGFSSFNSTMGVEDETGCRRKRKRGSMILGCEDWWVENLDLNKRLPLDKILERDVGLDAFPPSFVAGMEARKTRREKITSAKLRIGEIMRPFDVGLGGKKDVSSLGNSKAMKEWQQGRGGCNIDSEDCIIELLLLQGADEEKIEQGHYNTLLDLHVFDSLGSERLAFHRSIRDPS